MCLERGGYENESTLESAESLCPIKLVAPSLGNKVRMSTALHFSHARYAHATHIRAFQHTCHTPPTHPINACSLEGRIRSSCSAFEHCVSCCKISFTTGNLRSLYICLHASNWSMPSGRKVCATIKSASHCHPCIRIPGKGYRLNASSPAAWRVVSSEVQ